MTSIHASIPPDLKGAAMAAKGRGEEPGAAFKEETDQRPKLKGKSASSSSVIMKKLPQRLTSTQSAPISQAIILDTELGDEDDEASASKENEPALSPQPISLQSPRRPNLTKRPLSDLPCPTEDELDQPCITSSEQNVVNNIPESSAGTSTNVAGPSSHDVGRSLRDASTNAMVALQSDTDNGRSAKRMCSDETKENAVADYSIASYSRPSITKLSSMPAKLQSASARKASAPGNLGAGGGKGAKARIGLRRL